MESRACLEFSRWYSEQYPSESADFLDEFAAETASATDFDDPVEGEESACKFVGWFASRYPDSSADRVAEWEDLSDVFFDPLRAL